MQTIFIYMHSVIIVKKYVLLHVFTRYAPWVTSFFNLQWRLCSWCNVLSQIVHVWYESFFGRILEGGFDVISHVHSIPSFIRYLLPHLLIVSESNCPEMNNLLSIDFQIQIVIK